ATETISSGPYKIVGFTKGATTIRMVRNEQYWGKKPAFSEIIVTLLSPGAAIPALMATGEYDIIEVEKPAQVADLLRLPNVLVKSFPDANFWSWNMMFWVGLLINTAKYPLSEVAFRKAIAYALDRKMILEIATMGYGELSSMGFHPPNSPHLAPNLPEYTYNKTKAVELIEKLGFIKGPDGFWQYPNGTRLTLKVQARSGEETLVGSLIVTMLREIGIDASLETLAAALYVSNYNMGYFDMGVIKTSHPDLVDFLMMKFYWRPKVPIGTSIHYRGWTRWDNSTFGDLLEEYRATTDPMKAKELSHKMQRIIAEELPFIGLYYTRYIWAYRTDTLRGLEITDLGYNWPRIEFLTSILPVLPEVAEPIPMVPTLIAVIVAASAALVYISLKSLRAKTQ
ncbi:MAG: ABC transporter substrate-binding protein, partial [Candidatus Bathyarchaeia archaeon]